MIFEQAQPLASYLEPGPYVDFEHADVARFTRERFAACDAHEAASRIFHFVRDEVAHSWDVRGRRVTRTASDALAIREGICYPKSHLVAALLRSCGIPAAICYQRLTLLDDASAGHAIHALNAVFLEGSWHRIDARGNKPGVDARFSLRHECLAFAMRPELDECDYPRLYAQPHAAITSVLEANDDALAMYEHRLPDRLEAGANH